MSKTLTAEHGFYLSTSFFEFPFVRALLKEFGFKGLTTVIFVLKEIASSGAEVRYNRQLREKITKDFPDISDSLIKMIIRRMTDYKFLDKIAFVTRRVLTPPAEYIASSEDDIINEKVDKSIPYYIINSFKDRVSSEETIVNSEETHIITEETVNHHSLSLN